MWLKNAVAFTLAIFAITIVGFFLLGILSV